MPWGISESGYNRTDVQLNYQYRAFGVPGLGLKRGLAEDLVIAPYATAMALMIAPRAACENLQRLALEGREGAYGFYEAVDYTPSRLPPDETSATIRSFMAHHQGMSLLALVNLLQDYPMQRRFMACPLLKAADLLLQERVPKTAASVLSEDLKLEESRTLAGNGEAVMRVFTNPTPPAPEVHLLSNGRYHVVISSAGGGYSRWRDLAVTRWREDATRDCWGTFVYLRDLATGEFWSTAYQPTLRATKGYEAIFTQSRAEFRQRHAGLEIHTEISVSPEDDVELRRITITNRSSVARVIEVTSYAEVVLATPEADAAHPGFQQSLRANRIRAKILRHSLHAPRPFPGRKAAVAAASDGGSGRRTGGNLLRNGPLPDLSDAAEPWPTRPRCRAFRHCPTPSVPCSIPSFHCGARSLCRPMKPPSLIWFLA